MTDYKNIKGKKIKFFTSDLDNAQSEGQIFYSGIPATTSAVGTFNFKAAVASAAWSASAALNTARNGIASFGLQTAAVAATGADTTPSPSENAATEHYNGTGWSSAEDFPTNLGWGLSAGTQTAGLVFGGGVAPPGNTNSVNTTTEYDGTDWTAGGDMNSQRSQASGIGTQTAGLAVAGFLNTTSTTANSEEYDGSAWTEGDNANNARRNTGGLGTQTAGLLFGGGPPASPNNHSEEYDGTSWTEGNNLNTARLLGANNGAGIQTAGLAFGGSVDPPVSNATEDYDGTSWATSPASLATARYAPGCGTNTAAVAIGGKTTANVALTEEYHVTAMTVTQGAWASGGNLNTARFNGDSGNTPATTGIYFGGGAPPKGETEEYNGTAWTESGDLGTARTVIHGFGTQTTAVGAAGYVDGTGDVANVEEYNGSSWTEVTNTPAARRGGGSFGTLTAGVIVGGVPNLNTTLEYDGTNWASGGNIGTGMDRCEGAGAGTLTAGLVVAGDTTESFTYDGTNWTDVGTCLGPHDGGIDMGIQTAAIVATGFPPPGSNILTTVETYDGTSFSTAPSVAAGRYGCGKGAAGATAGFICGGDQNPGTVANTEEFTGATTALNLKTITDS